MSLIKQYSEDEIKEMLAKAKAEGAREYKEGTQKFRTWLRKQDPVWVAQRTATAVIIAEGALYMGWQWLTSIFTGG